MKRRVIGCMLVLFLLVCAMAIAEEEPGDDAGVCTDCGKAGELALLDMVIIATGPVLSEVSEEEIEGSWIFYTPQSGSSGGYGGYGGTGSPISFEDQLAQIFGIIPGSNNGRGWSNPGWQLPPLPPVPMTPPVVAPPYVPPGPPGPQLCDCSGWGAEQCGGYRCMHPIRGYITYGGVSTFSPCKAQCCGGFPWTPVYVEAQAWMGGGCCPGYDC